MGTGCSYVQGFFADRWHVLILDCEYTQNHSIVYFTKTNFIICNCITIKLLEKKRSYSQRISDVRKWSQFGKWSKF